MREIVYKYRRMQYTKYFCDMLCAASRGLQRDVVYLG
jgi:hypothetical protein